jgi:uncharacterized protein YbjT (DUF2867 family)
VKIAVSGGTGLVGRLVMDAVRSAGHQPVLLARSVGVDITTGAGLDRALAGSSAVIDVSNLSTTNRTRAITFFETGTRNLLAAGLRAGVTRHVALSIVGVDRVDLGYYAGKRHQEALVLAAGVTGSVLRATQFHEFAVQLLDRIRGPIVPVPRMRSQPIAAREVADALVRLAVQEPVGSAPDLAGPQVLEMPDLVRQLLHSRESRRIVLPVRVPGSAGRAMASGGLLPTGPGPRGQQTFADWLTEANRTTRTGGADQADSADQIGSTERTLVDREPDGDEPPAGRTRTGL